jgi:hypothetical protein
MLENQFLTERRTNREAALSPRGIAQIERQCLELKDEGVAPTIVRYSLAASAIDSANIVGRDLKVRIATHR